MKKNCLRFTALALTTVLLFAGCAKETKKASSEVSYPESGEIYPVECEDTLTVFTNYDTDTPKIDYWQEVSGVNVEFVTTVSGADEALSLLIASNDLPDVFLTNLFKQSGGIQKYADDNVIIDVTDYIDEYAPNFKKMLEKSDVIRKMSLSDDGRNYFFPCIRYEDILRSYRGPVIRKDLLEKYNLSEPETIDEWYEVLKTFKENGADAPLSYNLETYESIGGFLGAYGVVTGFYVDDGKVKYGYLEDGMREGLKTLAKWYKEGLIYDNIINADTNMESNVLTSKTCATFTTSGGGIGKYMNATRSSNPEFDLVGLKLPVLEKGSKPKFSQSVYPVTYDNNGFITTQCENIELAMRFLDFGYSERGHKVMNFGQEGVSYEMIDGYPTYTELIMNNPDGLAVAAAMTEYIFGNWSGPFAQDVAYIEQYNQLPQQKSALNLWGEMLDMTHTMPQVTFTSEESSKINEIMNNVNTCASENLYKFVMGIKSVDKDYDAFVKELKSFGIDEAIKIYTTALERYNKR